MSNQTAKEMKDSGMAIKLVTVKGPLESPTKLNIDSIPQELKDLPNWVLHDAKKKPYSSSGRLTSPSEFKKQINKLTGKREVSTTLNTFETFDVVYAAYLNESNKGRYFGIGFAPNGSGYVCMDLDNCVDYLSSTHSDTATEVLTSCKSYAEYSPSGTGIHVWVKSDFKGICLKPFEIYANNHYLTFTGNAIPGHTKLPKAMQDISQWTKNLSQPKIQPEDTEGYPDIHPSIPIAEIAFHLAKRIPGKYPEWMQDMAMVHHASNGSDEGLEAFHVYSQTGHGYDLENTNYKWSTLGYNNGAKLTFASLVYSGNQADLANDISPTKYIPGTNETSDVYDPADPFPRMTSEDFCNLPGRANWFIQNYLPKAEIGFVYGETGSGKTFFVIDMAFKLAVNQGYNGTKTNCGRVLYAAAEASVGVKKRMQAYRMTAIKAGIPHALLNRLEVMNTPFDLMNVKDVEGLVISCKKADVNRGIGERTELIIIDTMGASHSGDENSNTDMLLLINKCKHLYRETGCTILLVHHTGKDLAAGMRGAKALDSGADFCIEISKAEGASLVTPIKLKDGEIPIATGFKLLQVVTGVDDDGLPETSCIVDFLEEAPEPVPKATSKTRGPGKEKAEKLGVTDFKSLALKAFERARGDMPGKQTIYIDSLSEHAKNILIENNSLLSYRLSNLKLAYQNMVGKYKYTPGEGEGKDRQMDSVSDL